MVYIPSYNIWLSFARKTEHAGVVSTITLSPLEKILSCPGGQVLLRCERTAGSILYWTVTVSAPHLDTTRERIVPSQGDILLPKFKIGFTEFDVLRTSESPLISQLLINNVTAEINGSTIYCSEDGNENNAPMVAIDVIGSIPSKFNNYY